MIIVMIVICDTSIAIIVIKIMIISNYLAGSGPSSATL